MEPAIKDALDLVCHNMQETETNNKKAFARWKRGLEKNPFTVALLNLWTSGTPSDQERLAIAYPQLGYAILEWTTLSKVSAKRADKYLDGLLK